METGELALPVEHLSKREDLSKPQTLYKKPGMIHVIAIPVLGTQSSELMASRLAPPLSCIHLRDEWHLIFQETLLKAGHGGARLYSAPGR